MSRRFVALLLSAATLLTAPVVASPSPRDAIQAVYDDMDEAISLRFYQGMTLFRTPDFTTVDPQGRPVDLVQPIEQLLSRAMSVNDKTTILDFKQKDGKHVTCTVHNTLDVATVGSNWRRARAMRLELDETDDWVLTQQGWRQAHCRIASQKATTLPAPKPQ